MKDALDKLTPLGLMVLTLLGEGDMHPYEMIRLMRIRKDDRLVSITNGTMYHTVGRLQAAGLLVEIGVDRDGSRPERTTYSLTDAGADVAREWVRRELIRVDHAREFRIALAEAHNLERSEVLSLLNARRESLAEHHSLHERGLVAARTKGVPTQYLLELEREETLLRCDLSWLDTLIRRIADEEFPWGSHEPSDRYLAQREAARQ